MLLPIVSHAKDWTELTNNADISAALSGKVVRFDSYSFQVFDENGKTRYFTERVSDGKWLARDGKYCSAWPPSGKWTCYTFYRKDQRLRFILSDGTFSEGYYDNK